MKHFINRKTVQSSEILPSASYLQDYITHETDTGNVFISDGTNIYLSQGPERTEIIKNKQIDVIDNDLKNTKAILDNPFQPDFEVKGGVVPATTIQNSFYGILEDNITLHNTNKIVTTIQLVNSDSVLCEFRSGDFDDKMGFTSINPYFSRELGFEVKAVTKSVSRQFYFGFSTSNVINLTVAGVFIAFNEANNTFVVISSSGISSPQTIPFIKTKSGEFVTVEIILKSNSIVCKLDNETITLITKIPSLTDQLYLHGYGVV